MCDDFVTAYWLCLWKWYKYIYLLKEMYVDPHRIYIYILIYVFIYRYISRINLNEHNYF